MAPIKFPQFLNRYGIKLLVASTSNIVPGVIIEKRNSGFWVFGHLREVLGGSAASWATSLEPANLVYGTVERQLSLGSRASLDEFGVNIGGGLQRAKTVKFDLKGVRARIFRSRSKLSILPLLFNIRANNRQLWKKAINNKWIADYTYYASEVRFSFETDGGVNLQADISDHMDVSANVEIKWSTNRSFVVSNSDEVPFGFSGWKV